MFGQTYTTTGPSIFTVINKNNASLTNFKNLVRVLLEIFFLKLK